MNQPLVERRSARPASSPRRARSPTFNVLTLRGLLARPLGTFRCFRGFADLRDLADVSVSYKLASKADGTGLDGFQRELNEDHVERIRRFLLKSGAGFLPEVILSIRVLDKGDAGQEVDIAYPKKGPITVHPGRADDRATSIRIDLNQIEAIRRDRLIRRIDGNHRLAAAERIKRETVGTGKYIAPFCLVFFGPPGDADDDFGEARIFHSLNATALQLDSEHGLKLLLDHSPTIGLSATQEYEYDPELYLARKLRDSLKGLPQTAAQRFGERPLTSIQQTSKSILKIEPDAAKTRDGLNQFASDTFDAVNELLSALADSHPGVAATPFVLDLLARSWHATKAGSAAARQRVAVSAIREVSSWLEQHRLTELRQSDPLSQQLLEIYRRICESVPRKVFVSRWYPGPGTDKTLADLRVKQFEQALAKVKAETGVALQLVDLPPTRGGAVNIHEVMYKSIERSDIVVADLTGHRANVFIEAGFTLRNHDSARLVFVMKAPQRNAAAGAPADGIPFDFKPFRHVLFDSEAEIGDKLAAEIGEMVNSAKLGLPPAINRLVGDLQPPRGGPLNTRDGAAVQPSEAPTAKVGKPTRLRNGTVAAPARMRSRKS